MFVQQTIYLVLKLTVHSSSFIIQRDIKVSFLFTYSNNKKLALYEAGPFEATNSRRRTVWRHLLDTKDSLMLV